MGKLTGGPYYDLIGRTGNNVGRRVKGKNVFSMRPAKSSKPATPLQLAQRIILGELFKIIKPLKKLVRVGFGAYDAKMTTSNAATAYNYQNAVVGVVPNQSVDFTKLVYSLGDTSEPFNGDVEAVAGAKLGFSWQDSAEDEFTKDTDLATLLVYNEDKKVFLPLQGIVARSAQAYTYQLPLSFVGNTVYVYMSFVSVAGKPGNSVYLGQVTVV